MAVLPGNVVAARDEAGRLAEQAGGLQSQLPTIGDELRKRVNTLFGENQDVLGGFNTAVSNLVSAPGRSYETTQDVRDPFARERLAAIDLSTALQPTLAYGGLLGQRMGSIGDIVESGTNAFKAKVQAAATAAELARQKYQDLFQEFTTLEQMRQREATSQREAGVQGGDVETWAQALRNGSIAVEDVPANIREKVLSRFNQLIAGGGGTEAAQAGGKKGGGIIQEFIGGTQGKSPPGMFHGATLPAQLGALGSMVVQGYGGLIKNPKGTVSNILKNFGFK